MYRILTFLSLLLLLTSCHHKWMSKHPDEACKYCPTEKIIYKDSVVYKDTIIYREIEVNVPLPADTVYLTKYVRVENGIVTMDTVYKTNGLVEAWAVIIDSGFEMKAYLTDSVISYNYMQEEIRSIIEKYSSKQEQKVRVEYVKYIPWYIYIIFGVLLSIIGYLLFKRLF